MSKHHTREPTFFHVTGEEIPPGYYDLYRKHGKMAIDLGNCCWLILEDVVKPEGVETLSYVRHSYSSVAREYPHPPLPYPPEFLINGETVKTVNERRRQKELKYLAETAPKRIRLRNRLRIIKKLTTPLRKAKEIWLKIKREWNDCP